MFKFSIAGIRTHDLPLPRSKTKTDALDRSATDYKIIFVQPSTQFFSQQSQLVERQVGVELKHCYVQSSITKSFQGLV